MVSTHSGMPATKGFSSLISVQGSSTGKNPDFGTYAQQGDPTAGEMAAAGIDHTAMGSGLEGLNAPTDEYREAPGNRNNKYPGVPGESKDGFREAPSKWVNPDTIPSHKTRPAPGHDGSLVKGFNLVKGLKSLLNILIR